MDTTKQHFLGLLATTGLLLAGYGPKSRNRFSDPEDLYIPLSGESQVAINVARIRAEQQRRDKAAAKQARREVQRNQHKKSA